MTNDELNALLLSQRSGDITAFEKIYTELKTPVYTIIVRTVGDKDLAEDILQEVFIKLFRSPPTENVRNPRAYIFKTAQNLATDSMRKRRTEASLDELDDTAQEPEKDLALRMDVDTAMSLLTDIQRQIVTLHINGGIKFREIADIVNEPLGTVLWRYQYAVTKLRKYLSGGAT